MNSFDVFFIKGFTVSKLFTYCYKNGDDKNFALNCCVY